MPTYEFRCQAEPCEYEWEEWLSITAPNPEKCPKCETAGKILRLISGGSGRGVVTLTGQDLTNKIKSDATQIQREAARDEKKYANLLGENRHHELQTKMDRRGR
jgi:putative FmdB family regulatory protein